MRASPPERQRGTDRVDMLVYVLWVAVLVVLLRYIF
jgi:hypothetical protein